MRKGVCGVGSDGKTMNSSRLLLMGGSSINDFGNECFCSIC